MTIAIDEFRVTTATAVRPVNTTNQYAFSPALAEAVRALPLDHTTAVLVPVPENLPKKHGFVRAVRYFADRLEAGKFDVNLTVDGNSVQLMKAEPEAEAA